ncbi:outer membrane protein assembly factor BamD [Pigmentibacter sp. JX0631]|uniref:tetratricopeptide repeat protein n=1 Tax=Pigmentibacter sp. JX0631 TaxID=2976982 RepID=UPI002469A37C|nr:outer membrane protein assembly factor BamD [Pigmentibacter sp. JX0631]WGL60307.1 outer membrane protein assembly factor BamD [Pigmentibacter sp. JX0631]
MTKNFFVFLMLVSFSLISCVSRMSDYNEEKLLSENTDSAEGNRLAGNSKLDVLESSGKNHEFRIVDLENQVKKLNYLINDLTQDNNVSKKIISILKNDVSSLTEQLATNKKEIEIIKRGIRSGIFEDQPSEKQSPAQIGLSMLPDMNEGRDIYFEKKESPILPNTSSMQMKETNLADPTGPTQLIAEAEIKLRQAQYGEAILELNKLKKNYPNFDDKGHSYLLSSEAWLRLGEYNNVLNELRTYYIKFPNSPELTHAKLLEGQTYEKLNSKSKAAQIYQEVITLSPQSTDAQNARDGLLRMRDAK